MIEMAILCQPYFRLSRKPLLKFLRNLPAVVAFLQDYKHAAPTQSATAVIPIEERLRAICTEACPCECQNSLSARKPPVKDAPPIAMVLENGLKLG